MAAGQRSNGIVTTLLGSLGCAMRRLLFRVVASGPVPRHVAFIMDGNRRFARKWKLNEGAGHKAGFLAFVLVLKYCYEIGIKYVTVYAFSIDNFSRRADEVRSVMDLMEEKIESFLKEMDVVERYGVRVIFIGDLNLLYDSVRFAAEKAMEATAHNTNTYLLICVAYSSTHEITQAVYNACLEKSDDGGVAAGERTIKVLDLEKHMYMRAVPDPDVVVRSSGETRLSNFMLWQTENSLLYAPAALWPDVGFRQVVWGIVKYQWNYYYLEKKKKSA